MTQYQRQKGSYPPQKDLSQPSLPAGYLKDGYFDKDGNLLPQVIQDWPEALAKTFARERLTSTQLRRFFNRVRAIEQQDLPFVRLKEDILSIKPIAAASVGREMAPPIFKEFIDKNVELAIASENSFRRGFITHFQSVVAYLKYYEQVSKGGRR
jgi:CRISPR type III-A-associated protein Csm2